MKKIYLITFLLTLIVSCNQFENYTGSDNSVKVLFKRQIMKIAINYTRDRLKDAKEPVVKDGIFYIRSKQIKYVIDPAIIVTGLIDNDTNEDAIVNITSYTENLLLSIEHLILLGADGKFKVTAVIKGDMRILGIKDRIIFTEIPKVAPDSPIYDCSICKEVIKYRYYNGDLIRTE